MVIKRVFRKIHQKAIKLKFNSLLTNIGSLPALLDLDGLRQDLKLLASIQEECCALQRRVGQRWYTQIQVLSLDDFRDCWQLRLGKIPSKKKHVNHFFNSDHC